MPSRRLIGVGVFVVGGFILFAAGLFLIGDRRGLFSDNFEVYAEFSKLAGLESGATVRVAGLDAGEVKTIHVPTNPNAKFRIKLRIREEMHGVVRTNSVASIQNEGLVGNKFVQIEGGSAEAPRAPQDSTIQSRDPFDIADLLQQMNDTLTLVNTTVVELKGDVQEAIQTVTDTAGDARDIIVSAKADLEVIGRNGRRLSEDIRVVMDGIAAGHGTVGRLLKDDALYRDAQRIAAQAEQVVQNLREVSQQARQAVSDFNGKFSGKDSTAQGLAADIRQTVVHAREAMASLAENAEALKRNFFFRGFFNNRGYFDLGDISADAYRAGALDGKDRRVLRIWIDAPFLFDRDEQGIERLSDQGRARIDSAMSQFLKYPPTSPLVVEGYADDPTGDQRYITARYRASIVRDYIIAKFTLDANRVGLIVLGNTPPQSAELPAGSSVRGIGLALFVPR